MSWIKENEQQAHNLIEAIFFMQLDRLEFLGFDAKELTQYMTRLYLTRDDWPVHKALIRAMLEQMAEL